MWSSSLSSRTLAVTLPDSSRKSSNSVLHISYNACIKTHHILYLKLYCTIKLIPQLKQGWTMFDHILKGLRQIISRNNRFPYKKMYIASPSKLLIFTSIRHTCGKESSLIQYFCKSCKIKTNQVL